MSDADKVNILIVDDLPEKVLVVRSILEDLDQNIMVAHSGEEALRQVLEHDFAVILLDVNMPGMDGFETAGYIRMRKKSALTPIIFITAYADEMHTTQGYSLGAVDYIFSPVVPVVLRTKVKVFVDLFRMAQQVRRQADERVALAREQAARAAAEEATRRSDFLAEASKVLSSSLEFDATLRALARIVVPFLADLGAVIRVNEQGQCCQTEVAWVHASGEVRTQTFTGREAIPTDFAAAMERVLARQLPEVLHDLGDWPGLTADTTANGSAARGHSDFVLRSVAFVPLLARGRILGVLAMALGLSGRFHEQADLALAEDLAGRAAMSLDNARLYQDIQEGDRRKNEFLAMLAHELRNPLAPIRNAVQILRLLGLKEPMLVQSRDMIDRQVTHMARLIDDLLDMSRLSRGKILLRKERVDLVKIVRDTVVDYRGTLESAGLDLQLQLPEQSLYTQGDPVRLAQVVGNLLHNAVKFTDAGGRVRVTVAAESDGRQARITVRDSGIGMEEAILARIFQAFTQADRSLDRSRGGLGLGLALVKGLVEMHGGTVQASSAGLGHGTEVSLLLPLRDRGVALARKSAAPSAAGRAARVLVIEDNPDTAESMRLLLTLAGYPVEIAHSGGAGLEAARSFHPEIILCDLGLPGGMDGYAVARAIRHDPELASAHLIALTGYGQGEDRDRSRDAGFDRHFTKPVDFVELQQALAAVPVRDTVPLT
jgi:signal transduction histidine kinase/DNA-binding response OmpR family regulator